jgi:ribosomal protein S1
MAKSRQFRDDFDDLLRDSDLSDAQLEALLAGPAGPAGPAGGAAGPAPIESLEAGARVEGVVIDVRGGEVLVELDQKTLGVVEAQEFGADELPEIGSKLRASFERFDRRRDLAVLSVRATRREVVWDQLRPGVVLEGVVKEANKGGLILDIKGERAFLPISQIERERVEDAGAYLGKNLLCEVTSFDRASGNLVVSRRTLLERQAEELKGLALARLGEGEALTGTVVRLNEHGAFIDLGGVEGLLHASKLKERRRELARGGALEAGDQLEVVVTRVDRERGRVSLDLKAVAGASWSQSVEGYAIGDEATGWVTRVTEEGAQVSLEEGVEGVIPRRLLLERRAAVKRGDILRCRITALDRESRRIELAPLVEGAKA